MAQRPRPVSDLLLIMIIALVDGHGPGDAVAVALVVVGVVIARLFEPDEPSAVSRYVAVPRFAGRSTWRSFCCR